MMEAARVPKGKVVPQNFSTLGLYGDKETFQARLNEGYRYVAFGRGPWVGTGYPERVIAMFAFYKSKKPKKDDTVATFEGKKFEEIGACTVHGPMEDKTYTFEDFQNHIENYEVELGVFQPLKKIVNLWA